MRSPGSGAEQITFGRFVQARWWANFKQANFYCAVLEIRGKTPRHRQGPKPVLYSGCFVRDEAPTHNTELQLISGTARYKTSDNWAL